MDVSTPTFAGALPLDPPRPGAAFALARSAERVVASYGLQKLPPITSAISTLYDW
jgi:hypothetical protein